MKQNLQKRPRGRPRSVASEAGPGTVQALDRGLTLLRELADARNITLSDLAIRAGMPASSTHRILSTLQKHDFVEFNESTQEWMIGIEAFRTGNSYLVRTNLVEAARKSLRHLMEETGETANLAIVDSGDVVFVDQVETHNPIRAFFRPGTRGHMHSSGIGKSLLADMPRRDVEKIIVKKGLPGFTANTLTSSKALFDDLNQIRQRGWSIDDEERHSGMRCVAANIYNNFGEAIAGISVSGPSVRFPDQMIAELGPKVKRAADEVTRSIGGKIPDQYKWSH
ncbi:MAG: IclR family transcriptional regulator [Gammaproteobacteria bacterium]|nr:IclR family transcriptional regulator [Gammaproteobacteria bacterium]